MINNFDIQLFAENTDYNLDDVLKMEHGVKFADRVTFLLGKKLGIGEGGDVGNIVVCGNNKIADSGHGIASNDMFDQLLNEHLPISNAEIASSVTVSGTTITLTHPLFSNDNALILEMCKQKMQVEGNGDVFDEITGLTYNPDDEKLYISGTKDGAAVEPNADYAFSKTYNIDSTLGNVNGGRIFPTSIAIKFTVASTDIMNPNPNITGQIRVTDTTLTSFWSWIAEQATENDNNIVITPADWARFIKAQFDAQYKITNFNLDITHNANARALDFTFTYKANCKSVDGLAIDRSIVGESYMTNFVNAVFGEDFIAAAASAKVSF